MPWCDECSKYYAPSGLNADGTCPVCGRDVGKPTAADKLVESGGDEKAKIPWHFWVMLIALAIYLGWRAIQGVMWVIERLT